MKKDAVENTFSYKSDASKIPATIDSWRVVDGVTYPPSKGIWKVEKTSGTWKKQKTTLTICTAYGEADRPIDFTPTSDNVLMVFERVER